MPRLKDERDDVWQSCHLNMALCHLRMGNEILAINQLNQLISKFPNNLKAHYRKAECHRQMRDYGDAIKELKLILSIDLTNAQAKQELAAITIERDEYKRTRLKTFEKLFQQ